MLPLDNVKLYRDFYFDLSEWESYTVCGMINTPWQFKVVYIKSAKLNSSQYVLFYSDFSMNHQIPCNHYSETWKFQGKFSISVLSFSFFIPHQQGWRGDIETVSVRPSIHPSIRPKKSHLTATIFHRSLPNLYSMFISLKNFIICSFIKKWQKLLPWQPFFFLSFNAYLFMFIPYMKAWR